MLIPGGCKLNILVVETASKIQMVLLQTSSSMYNYTFDAGITHTSTLIQNIDSILKASGIKKEELEVLIVGIGPGSFTGLRIAVTTVRAMSQVLGIPIIPVNTHELITMSFRDKTVLTSFDAKKNRVFGAVHQIYNSKISPILSPGDYPISLLLDKLKDKDDIVIVGDGSEKYLDEIENYINDCEIITNFKPNERNIFNYICDNYIQSISFLEYNKVFPLYKRKSDAEVAKSMNNYT